ncbi:MAG: hypothetical protein ACN6PX_11680 [Stenotrophomonas lactitubi]|uniref:hypothetical protein n=1 Tax=Stenotrophomonas lactitubi TaxID=2045214 RepID=UPI003D120053
MHRQISPTCHDAIALRAGALGSVLGVVLFKVFALSAAAAGSMMTVGLWLLGCVLLAACLTCLALSRRVFVLMLVLSTVFLICIA